MNESVCCAASGVFSCSLLPFWGVVPEEPSEGLFQSEYFSVLFHGSSIFIPHLQVPTIYSSATRLLQSKPATAAKQYPELNF